MAAEAQLKIDICQREQYNWCKIFVRAVLYLKSAFREGVVVGGAWLLSMQTCMSGIRSIGSL